MSQNGPSGVPLNQSQQRVQDYLDSLLREPSDGLDSIFSHDLGPGGGGSLDDDLERGSTVVEAAVAGSSREAVGEGAGFAGEPEKANSAAVSSVEYDEYDPSASLVSCESDSEFDELSLSSGLEGHSAALSPETNLVETEEFQEPLASVALSEPDIEQTIGSEPGLDNVEAAALSFESHAGVVANAEHVADLAVDAEPSSVLTESDGDASSFETLAVTAAGEPAVTLEAVVDALDGEAKLGELSSLPEPAQEAVTAGITDEPDLLEVTADDSDAIAAAESPVESAADVLDGDEVIDQPVHAEPDQAVVDTIELSDLAEEPTDTLVDIDSDEGGDLDVSVDLDVAAGAVEVPHAAFETSDEEVHEATTLVSSHFVTNSGPELPESDHNNVTPAFESDLPAVGELDGGLVQTDDVMTESSIELQDADPEDMAQAAGLNDSGMPDLQGDLGKKLVVDSVVDVPELEVVAEMEQAISAGMDPLCGDACGAEADIVGANGMELEGEAAFSGEEDVVEQSGLDSELSLNGVGSEIAVASEADNLPDVTEVIDDSVDEIDAASAMPDDNPVTDDKEVFDNQQIEDNTAGLTPELPVGSTPSWVGQELNCVVVQVHGINIAIPMDQIESATALENVSLTIDMENDWILGQVFSGDHTITYVLDSACWLMPELYDPAKAHYTDLLMLQGGYWGIACDEMVRSVRIPVDKVSWAVNRNKRPWLLGTYMKERCAILDVDALIDQLNAAF